LNDLIGLEVSMMVSITGTLVMSWIWSLCFMVLVISTSH
jgi:hypothetical protein